LVIDIIHILLKVLVTQRGMCGSLNETGRSFNSNPSLFQEKIYKSAEIVGEKEN